MRGQNRPSKAKVSYKIFIINTMYHRTDECKEQNQARSWYKVTESELTPLASMVRMDLSEDQTLELQPE